MNPSELVGLKLGLEVSIKAKNPIWRQLADEEGGWEDQIEEAIKLKPNQQHEAGLLNLLHNGSHSLTQELFQELSPYMYRNHP